MNMANETATVPPAPDWIHAGEDYEPGDIAIPGLEVIDDRVLHGILTDAAQAVKDKKNAKQIFDVLIQSVKTGVNLFRPGLI